MSSRHLRTLWLIGFTCAVAGLSACMSETGGRAPRCVDDPSQRYFNVHWEIDNGSASNPLPPLSCAQAPVSHVELTTNTNQLLQVGVGCQDGTLYNFTGSTNAGLAVGTIATLAELVSDADNTTVLSSASTPQLPITACGGVDFQIQFPLTP
jgi:hypothetical protein